MQYIKICLSIIQSFDCHQTWCLNISKTETKGSLHTISCFLAAQKMLSKRQKGKCCLWLPHWFRSMKSPPPRRALWHLLSLIKLFWGKFWANKNNLFLIKNYGYHWILSVISKICVGESQSRFRGFQWPTGWTSSWWKVIKLPIISLVTSSCPSPKKNTVLCLLVTFLKKCEMLHEYTQYLMKNRWCTLWNRGCSSYKLW